MSIDTFDDFSILMLHFLGSLYFPSILKPIIRIRRRELSNHPRDTILIFLWNEIPRPDIRLVIVSKTLLSPFHSFAYSHKRRFRFRKLGMLQPIGKVASSKRDKDEVSH